MKFFQHIISNHIYYVYVIINFLKCTFLREVLSYIYFENVPNAHLERCWQPGGEHKILL